MSCLCGGCSSCLRAQGFEPEQSDRYELDETRCLCGEYGTYRPALQIYECERCFSEREDAEIIASMRRG